jgi:hypothetical protein
MSTNRTFQDMLNDYLPNDLLKEETVKRDYIMQKVDRDDDWNDGPLVVPFKAAGASSIAFGGLTAEDDIAEDKYVRGEVSAPKEAWGSMVFNHRDIMEHGKISEQNFLKLLPDTVEDFVDNFKNVMSTNMLNGAHFATQISDHASAASGVIHVDRPDRFMIGQKVIVDDDNSSPVTGYVRSIDMENQTVTLYDARTGGSVVNLSGYTIAQNAKCYHDGAQSNSFTSLRESLLSAANGGSTQLYGQTKTAYPYLQAIQIDGSSMTSATIVRDIFRGLVKVAKFGKGKPTEALMSLTNLGYCMEVIENQKGSFNVVPNSQKASEYGWMEIMVGSPTHGMIKLVGIQEADDDVIMFIDWRAIKLYTNGFFQKRKSPDGNEYFEIRATTGFKYIVDICLLGELVLQRPSYCGIIHSIDIAEAEGEVA